MMFVYDYRHVQKGRSFFIVLSIVLLVCMVGFRYRMGTDTITYMNDFDTFPKLSNFHFEKNQHYAPLFTLLMSIMRTISDQFWVFQLSVAIFINVTLLQSIRRAFGDDFFFTFLIIYFVGPCFNLNCESLRETIAVSFFFLSIPYLMESNLKRYYLLSAIAIGFHYGAVFLLIIPFIKKLRFNMAVLIAAGVLLVLSPFFVEFFPLLLSLPGVSGHIQELVIMYIDASRDANIGDLSINYYLIGVFLPIICCLFLRKWAPELSKYEFLVVIFVAVKILSRVLIILYRYENYVCLFYYALYAAFVYHGVIYLYKIFHFKLFLVHLIILFPIVYASIRLWEADYVDVYQRVELIDPYCSIFDEETSPTRESLYNFIGRY